MKDFLAEEEDSPDAADLMQPLIRPARWRNWKSWPHRGGPSDAVGSRPQRQANPKVAGRPFPEARGSSARRAIDSLMAPMLADVAARLAGLDSMTRIADVILALREAQEVWERAFSWKAEGLAGRWALDVDVIAKEKLGRAVGKALGIDMAMILDAPDVAVSVRLASMEAADLIRKIPTDYIGRISGRSISPCASSRSRKAGRWRKKSA